MTEGNERSYWLDLFTWKTWQEFLAAGASISGFRLSRWGYVKQMKPGDYMLCYLTGISRFIGILEVTSAPYQDDKTVVWSAEAFPARVRSRVVVQLKPETAIPVESLVTRFSWYEKLKNLRGAGRGTSLGPPSTLRPLTRR